MNTKYSRFALLAAGCRARKKEKVAEFFEAEASEELHLPRGARERRLRRHPVPNAACPGGGSS